MTEQEKQEHIINDLVSLCNTPAFSVFSYLTKFLKPKLIETAVHYNEITFKAEEYNEILNKIRTSFLNHFLNEISYAKAAYNILQNNPDFKLVATPMQEVRVNNEIRYEFCYSNPETQKKSKWGFYIKLAGYGYYSTDYQLVGPFFKPIGIYWQFEDNPLYELRYDNHGNLSID